MTSSPRRKGQGERGGSGGWARMLTSCTQAGPMFFVIHILRQNPFVALFASGVQGWSSG